MAIEKRTECPIKVLGGWWATRGNGNFVYTLAGDVSEATALSFKKWLCGPFLDADILPTAGWVWAHLREVRTTDENGVIWDSDRLLKEIRQNFVFEDVTLCAAPRWQVPPERIMTQRSTVLVAYTDRTGDVTKAAIADSVFMFGSRIKFIIAGDQPAPVQCGRCHELGHWANAPVCKIPKSVVRCYKCGGAHDSRAHSYHCKGAHKTAGVCDCVARCLLCKKSGHDARSRKCPQRGNFAPPPICQAHGRRQPRTTARRTCPAPSSQEEKGQR